jgi:cysteine synthase A
MHVASDVSALVGGTPLVRLGRLSAGTGATLLGKLETRNPGGSVKDRVARAMLEAAEASGRLGEGATLVEPTSGNTGIALAMMAAARGLKLVLTMPETMSRERVALLRALGAEVVLTRGALMGDAVRAARRIADETPGALALMQFDNPENPAAHEATTGPELWADTAGTIDVFVAGVGTGGTITGVGRYLKRMKPGVRVVAVEPSRAAVLSGKRARGHRIQGIGAGFVPAVLDRSVLDEVLTVDDEVALTHARRLAREEGLLVGISSGAAVAAALALARRPAFAGKTIVTMLCDSGERYLSTELFEV